MIGSTTLDSVVHRLKTASLDVTRWDVLRLLRVMVILAVVVPSIIYAAPQVVGASQSYVVLSGSMEPTISTGDVIVVEDVPTATIESGDVITFGGSRTEPSTTHRVIGIEQEDGERVFRTKGDANENPDAAAIHADDVVGKVMELPSVTGGQMLFVIPYFGYVMEFLERPMGFLLLIVLPFCILALSELWLYARTDDGTEDEDGDTSGTGEPSSPPHADTDVPVADDEFAVDTQYLPLVVAILAVGGTAITLRAYRVEDPVMLTVGVGALTGAVVVSGLALFGADTERRSDSDIATARRPTGAAARTRVVSAAVPSRLRTWPRIDVGSAETLLTMATRNDSWIIEDESTGEWLLFSHGVTYASATDDGADDTSEQTLADAPVSTEAVESPTTAVRETARSRHDSDESRSAGASTGDADVEVDEHAI